MAEAGQPAEETAGTDGEAARREHARAAPQSYALTPDKPATASSQLTPNTDQYEQDFYPDTDRQAVQQTRDELVQKMHEETLRRERAERRQQQPDHAHHAQGQEEDLPPTQAYGPTAELIDALAEVTASQQRHAEELAKQEERGATTKAPAAAPPGDSQTCSPTAPFVPHSVPPQPTDTVSDSPLKDGSDGSVASVLLRPPAQVRQRTTEEAVSTRPSEALVAFPNCHRTSAGEGGQMDGE